MQINTIFSIMIALGAGLGLFQVYRLAPARHAARQLDAAVVILLAAVVGARAGFVMLNWAYFFDKPLEGINPGSGGLSWIGALVAALIALPLAAYRFKLPLPILADSTAHLLPPLAVAAWLGCWLAGSGYAPAVVGQPWWAIAAPDETGLAAARFPLQPAAALLLALEFLLAQSLTGARARPGTLASRFGLALGLNLLFFSFFTADPAPLWHGGRLSTWGAAALILLSLAGMLWSWLAGREARVPALSHEPGERPVHSQT